MNGPFKWRQYPTCPCFVVTINKSHGGTSDVEGLDASSPKLSHGQVYVALSSVRDFDKITVLTPNEEATIQNMVFPQVTRIILILKYASAMRDPSCLTE